MKVEDLLNNPLSMDDDDDGDDDTDDDDGFDSDE